VAAESAHIYTPLTAPAGWCMYRSSQPEPSRLVVFVHGFNGKPVKTWRQFDQPDPNRAWWAQSDLLFVGYNSLSDSIVGVANRLRKLLPDFYPSNAVEPDEPRTYQELFVLAHSLGGLIVRRAVLDSVELWLQRGKAGEKPVLVDSAVRLFSPAIAGYRLAGILGVVKAFGLINGVEVYLNKASAFIDLEPDSYIIKSTRKGTEKLVLEGAGFQSALQPAIVWASPDNIVIEGRYDTDEVDDSWDRTTHTSVCKPKRLKFEKPWIFAESGDQNG
jgi:hypothetical protein